MEAPTAQGALHDELWSGATSGRPGGVKAAGAVSSVVPRDGTYHRFLVKFLLISALSLLIGAVHGMLQVLPPIRAWLDSIGSPYGGPGHMIDPLAHAHMNLVGGVVMFVIAVTYYLLPILSGRPLYSLRLIQHSFWLMTVGVYGFYGVQMLFGIWEGNLLLHHSATLPALHHWYGRLVALSGMTMAAGFVAYFANVALTMVSRPLAVARGFP